MWSLGVSKWKVSKMILRFHTWTVGQLVVLFPKTRSRKGGADLRKKIMSGFRYV